MRGEETQLLGLSALVPGFSGLVVMPGTHSKWALLDGTRLATRFSSAMTGEVFELLRTHSVLRHSLGGELEGEDRDLGFFGRARPGPRASGAADGDAVQGTGRIVCFRVAVRRGAPFLSGLLIGAEIGGQRPDRHAEIPLIGSVGLCGLYQIGFDRLGSQNARRRRNRCNACRPQGRKTRLEICSTDTSLRSSGASRPTKCCRSARRSSMPASP